MPPTRTRKDVSHIQKGLPKKAYNRAHLKKRVQSLKRVSVSHLTDEQLTRLKIQTYPLDLERNEANQKAVAQFFRPPSDEVFQKVDHPEIDFYPSDNPHNPPFYKDLDSFMGEVPGPQKKPEWVDTLIYERGDCLFENGDLYDAKDRPIGSPHMWQLVRTFKPLDSSFPHLVTHLANRCEADESLFRSEVIAICEIMGRRMASPDLEKHEIFPVLMVSMFIRQARILQAHFDGRVLHIQKSKLYDFNFFNQSTFNLFLKWRMSDLIGDTTASTKDSDLRIRVESGDVYG